MLISDDVEPFPADLLDDDHAVVSAAGSGPDRRATLRPSSAARATPAQHEAIHDLQHVALEVRRLQADLRELAQEARSLGVSWGLIGWSVGLTAEGARQKYGDPESRPRSSRPTRRRSRGQGRR